MKSVYDDDCRFRSASAASFSCFHEPKKGILKNRTASYEQKPGDYQAGDRQSSLSNVAENEFAVTSVADHGGSNTSLSK
jgi:hypothetical protein